MPLSRIKTGSIADDAVTSSKVATGGIATIDMADGSVTTLKIAAGAVVAEDLANGAVTPVKLSTGAPTWDSSGLLSMGTQTGLQSNTWQSGIDVSRVGTQGSISYGGGTNFVLGVNRYFNSGEKFIGSGFASAIEQSSGNTTFFVSNASGTANNAITYNYPMQIHNSGTVLINGASTTIPTPTSGYVLDVRGNVVVQRTSGNVGLVVSTSNANGAMNAFEGFGLDFNTDSTNRKMGWSMQSSRKMWLVQNLTGAASLGVNISNPEAYVVNNGRTSIVTDQSIYTNDSVMGRIQSRGYGLIDTGSNTYWIRLGTWYTAQAGWMINLRIVAHQGFNANPAQQQMTDWMFSTANGSSGQTSPGGGIFYAAGTAIRMLNPGTQAGAPSALRVVQIDGGTYEFWGQFGSFTNGSFYTILGMTDGSSWFHNLTFQSAAPTGTYMDQTIYQNTYS